jgi:non-specific serine/threonine protein kinase
VEAAPELSRLLEACPNLTLLCTSRELLRVQGEVEYPVLPLASPEAVALFCERARLEASGEISELCARLDNLPLAVELAAARTKALSPAQILERLSQRLDLLKGGRDADPRQQTLRATIAWSYDLLQEEEQRLFRALSVFAGGCTLEAAEEVAGADLDTMQSLVEKSLLRFTASDAGSRYWMLETIREYAGERLDPRDAEEVQRRLRRWIVAQAEASAPKLHTGQESAESARLAPEYENLRAAISYALAARQPDDVGRILGSIYPFLISRGRPTETREWTEAVLADRERLSRRGLADALVGGSELARFAGDLARAVELKEELASIEGDAQRPNWRAATLADLSEIALVENDLERARRYAEASAVAGGGPRVELDFGEIALRLGELDRAEAHGQAASAAFERGSFNHACALELLAETARRSGDAALARERFETALREFADLRDGCVADCLEGLSRVALEDGAGDRAGRLLGAAERLREESGRGHIRSDIPLPDVPENARAAGAAMDFDAAVAYALASLD